MKTKYIRVNEIYPHKALQNLAKAIVDAAKQGYIVSDDIKHVPRELGHGQYDITLVLPEAQDFALPPTELKMQSFPREVTQQPETVITTFPPVEDNPVLSHLEACKTKQELLDFAARHAIVVPEELKVFTAVKKYIKDQFVGKPVVIA